MSRDKMGQSCREGLEWRFGKTTQRWRIPGNTQGTAWGGCGSSVSQDLEAQRSQEFPAEPALTGG